MLCRQVTSANPLAPRITSACSYALNPPSAGHDSGPAAGGFSVSTLSGCRWAAQSGENWIHTTTSSIGTGSVSYTIDANPNPSPRIGTIYVEGDAFTIKQSGNGCVATLTPTSGSHGAGPEVGSFGLSTPAGCVWSASTEFGWIHTTSVGNGAGTVHYSVDAFAGPGTRTGRITVLEQSFAISQTGESEKPAISSIPDQKLLPGVASAPIPFRLTGGFTDLTKVAFALSSSNQGLIPNDNILFGISGTDRVLVLVPTGQIGISRITISATDPNGVFASTSFMTVVGDLPRPRFNLASVLRDSAGRFGVSLSGPAGGALVVQVSPDLRTWTDLKVLSNPSGELDYTDSSATELRRQFYRLKSAPLDSLSP